MPMLQVQAVDSGYDRARVLHGISLDVSEREIVCLLGSNGAGKTTTLLTILGMLRPSSGSILFEGDRIDGVRTPEIVRRGIAVVPEGRRIFGPLTVEENLRVGAAVYGGDTVEADMEAVFDLFPVLRERRHQPGGTLSGGQQQMLAIGRALMTHPRLILMDEPSMGLSPVLCDQVFEIIRSITEKGVAVLLVEQNAYASLAIADRGYVMQAGEIVLAGQAADLREANVVKEAYL